MHDSFDSPFRTIQKGLYQYTKQSIPIWFPRRRTRTGTNRRQDENEVKTPTVASVHQNPNGTLILGQPIRTSEFKSDDKLIETYWAAVEKLFEDHKVDLSHAGKSLSFLPYKPAKMDVGTTVGRRMTIGGLISLSGSKFVSSSPLSLSPALLSMLRFATLMNVVVLGMTFIVFAYTGSWWRSRYDSIFIELGCIFHASQLFLLIRLLRSDSVLSMCKFLDEV